MGTKAEEARLLEAAPDLLEACKEMLIWIENAEQDYGCQYACGNIGRAAIQKASGQ